jgi:tetratricopeptide (TPR) repeat protein
MKYFELMIFLGALGAGIGAWAYYMRLVKAAFYRAMLRQEVMQMRQKNERLIFVSDYALSCAAQSLLEYAKEDCRRIMSELKQNNYAPLVECVKAKNEVLSLGLLAHFAPEQAEKQIKTQLKIMPDNADLLLFAAEFYALKFDYAALKKTLDKILLKKLNALAKAECMLLRARLLVYEADMAGAVRLLAESGKIFKRRGCYYGESEVYFVAGEIYRVCAISDVSQMMFETAGNIAAKIGSRNDEAKSLAAKGMLTAGQNRFAEAADFFKRSRKIFHQAGFVKSESEIINQQALLFVMQGKLAMGVKYAVDALNRHKEINNQAGIAQSAEIMAMAFFRQKKYAESLEQALAAQKGYLETKNYAAYFDAAFLEIQALFMQNWLEAAEQRCLRVLQQAEKHRAGLCLADIYGFLGTIYLRQNNLPAAKKMFSRSVKLETLNGRDAGAASDYANLALIEYKLSNYAKAKKYAAQAKAAAERSGNKDLVAAVCKQTDEFC